MWNIVCEPDGTITRTEIPDDPAETGRPNDAVLAAVATARAEVAGYAQSNGTRQAVEALATAVETLVQGATP